MNEAWMDEEKNENGRYDCIQMLYAFPFFISFPPYFHAILVIISFDIGYEVQIEDLCILAGMK